MRRLFNQREFVNLFVNLNRGIVVNYENLFHVKLALLQDVHGPYSFSSLP